MKFSELTKAGQQLNSLVKSAGIISGAASLAAAPVKAVGKGLWGASKRAGGPFAPLLFGGTVLGGVAAGKKAIAQGKNYAQGFNPLLQESLVRG